MYTRVTGSPPRQGLRKQLLVFNRRHIFLLLPVYVCIAIFTFPFLRGIYMGFTDYRLGYPMKINWLENYLYIYESEYFWASFRNLFHIVFVSLISIFLISFILALILDSKLIFRGFWRSIIILPWAVPPVAKVVIWQYIYNPTFGHLNYFLKKLGIIKEYLLWTKSPDLAIYTVIIITVWGSIPFVTLCLLAALQGIPKDVFEAAKIDGANSFQEFRYITMPFCKSVLVMTSILMFMWMMHDFGTPYLLTGGGPGSATLTPSLEAYRQGFSYGNFGIGAAYGNIMILLTVFFLYVYTRHILRLSREEA